MKASTKMFIDCHYHYEPGAFDVPKLLEAMDASGVEKIALIPAVAGVFPSEPRKFIMRFMRFMFGKRAFFPLLRKMMCTFEGDGIRILGAHVPIYFLPNNDEVFAAAEEAPDRLFAYIAVNPDRQSPEEMRAEMERFMEKPAFCGVKVHPFYHQYDIRKLENICQILAPLHKPLLVHMDFNAYDGILELADRHPQVNFILAHCAFPYFDLIWPEIWKRKNLYVDISSGCYVDSRTARKATIALGPERILYGSDGPYGPAGSDGRFDMSGAYDWATKALPPDVRAAVSRENFLRLIQ